MRIISKFSDYYDAGLVYGIDETIYFKRAKTETGVFGTPRTGYYSSKDGLTHIADGYIGFCGVLYPFKAVLTAKGEPLDLHYTSANSNKLDYQFYYTGEAFLQAIGEEARYYRSYTPEYFIPRKDNALFIERKVPYFHKITIPNFLGDPNDPMAFSTASNLPILKNFQFKKVFDAFAAFQELSMYLPTLFSEEGTCDVEDKYRVAGHGFNCMSFRKEGKHTKKC